jgi:hypothetical protein
MTLNLIDQTSYVKATGPLLPDWLKAATIEFWIKPQNTITNNNYIFSMWAD